jgi:hypothetical protein
MTTNQSIRKHANFNSDDYAYLAAKGWTDDAIIERWDAEAKSGKGACRWFGPARSKLTAVTGRK